MIKKILLSTFMFSLVFAVGAVASANTDATSKHVFKASLSGNEEVPAVSTSGSGHMELYISRDEREIHYKLHVDDLSSPITGAHLHCASRGSNGPVVVPLNNPMASGSDYSLYSEGVITRSMLTEAAMTCSPNIRTMPHLVQAMREGKIYVNVHTEVHPAGEVRGQLALHNVNKKPQMDRDHKNNKGKGNTGTVMVMNHVCNTNINSRADFEALGSFVNKLLACPTAILPHDNFSTGAVAGPKVDFDFLVVGENGKFQTINNAHFMQTKVCETDINQDVTNDGQISADTCLDTSHYSYEGVKIGKVFVAETKTPANTRFGALQFTPSALVPNEDEKTLTFLGREGNGVIVLDTKRDNDNMVMVHVYNFLND